MAPRSSTFRVSYIFRSFRAFFVSSHIASLIRSPVCPFRSQGQTSLDRRNHKCLCRRFQDFLGLGELECSEKFPSRVVPAALKTTYASQRLPQLLTKSEAVSLAFCCLRSRLVPKTMHSRIQQVFQQVQHCFLTEDLQPRYFARTF